MGRIGEVNYEAEMKVLHKGELRILRSRKEAMNKAREEGRARGYSTMTLTPVGWKGEKGVAYSCGCVTVRDGLGGEVLEQISCKRHEKENQMMKEDTEMATKTKGTAAKKETEKEEGYKGNGKANMINCPECGIENPKSNVKCFVCGTNLLRKKATKSNASGEPRPEVALFELNKRLDKAIDAGDDKKADEIKGFIKTAVGKTNGAYKVTKTGHAEQSKTGVKKEAAPRTKKADDGVVRLCPCCGKKTGGGSCFIPGHDARVKGMLKRMEEGTQKEAVPDAVKELFKLKKKHPEASVKELALMLKPAA